MTHNFPVCRERTAVDDRQLLAKLGAGALSGDALARELGLTRAAVWKRIQSLRAAGVEIHGRAGDGYRLGQPLELLDAARIKGGLPDAVQTMLASLDIDWSLASTNTELLQRSAPLRGVAVLLAERQTGGRGRRGRHWASPLAAHIYVSLSRAFAGGLSRMGGLSLAMGVAVVEALHALGFAGAGLKWPNDVLVDGRKLGGLLVEGGGEFAGPARAVIGLGLNVRMPVTAATDITQPWTDLDTLAGAPVSRNAVVTALLSALLPALEQFEQQGLAPFLPRYAAMDVLQGRGVRVEEAGVMHEGVACGLAEDGALKVRMGEVETHFHAGEVSVRAA
ncbi:bifunctional biotin--[acetyl-CoA-carboxylase] ligase/biotin operon repressor BirA [Stenotrophomonas sp. SY1]|uniref:bifunctional biotin--[acetyl-CoA-carboxylase] ligase/biotin operon repressor BirA n=1 Tax=Stenotrophomonas sp. SY1 TaxID=477235 RepID=UPI001E4D83B5|nr:bifunctional biotin--[acetyl-CoA-carboxylase] ligase/biotin operon repressor BirA [Stenotrophomonas sp. SY1]MCD9085564.1 bifunctional biotin--[acetyl-CoA-carboxylase] ligase/biotin operon repressor BirA [Stenotrophomonas sp. SY1]